MAPIDSTRAQNSNRALAYPTYVLIPHEGFAYFEQCPHGLMEVVRVNWPIMREFITPFCPMGMLVDRVEMQLSGVPLTEQLMDCWNGFYARVVLTYHGAPAAVLQPYAHLWAPLPHLSHEPILGWCVSTHCLRSWGHFPPL